jgi:hypothetical protein
MDLLRQGLQLWHQRRDRSPASFATRAKRIDRAIGHHLRPRRLTDR